MEIIVKVKSRSSREFIEEVDENTFIVGFNVAREKGKANMKLIDMLANFFKVRKSNISIKSGFTSTRKVLKIDNVTSR